jgi:hypothetical protein
MHDIIEDSILSALLKKIKIEAKHRADHIASGKCTDFVDYRHHTGFLEGLSFVEVELLEMVENANRAD